MKNLSVSSSSSFESTFFSGKLRSNVAMNCSLLVC